MQVLGRVKRATTPAQVAEQIIQAIRRGDLAPGQRLPTEQELCTVFGVGRNSLREAVRFLELAGVLDVRPGEGTSVTVDETGPLAQAVDLQIRLTPRSALEAVQRMHDAEDLEAFAQADVSFHAILTDASHNVIMRHMIHALRMSISDWIHQVLRLPGSRGVCYEEHVLILRAISDHDAARARAAMEAHLTDVGQRLIQVIKSEESRA